MVESSGVSEKFVNPPWFAEVERLWGPSMRVEPGEGRVVLVRLHPDLRPDLYGLPQAVFEARAWPGTTRILGWSDPDTLALEGPVGAPLSSWLEALTPGRRLWHATRVAVALAIFWESWRTSLARAGVEAPTPLLMAEHVFVEPHTGAVTLSLAHAMLGMSASWFVAVATREGHPPLDASPCLPPELGATGTPNADAAVVYQLGRMVRRLLGVDVPTTGGATMVEVLLGAVSHPATPLTDLPIPPALADALSLAVSPDPAERPSLRDFVASMLHQLGGHSPPEWLALPLDGITEHLRDHAFNGDLTEAALLFAVRPDAASTPTLQDYAWAHFGPTLMAQVRGGAPLTALQQGLLAHMRAAPDSLAELLLDEAVPTASRVEVARILGASGTATAHEVLARALDLPTIEVAVAARDALAASPVSPPLAWYPRSHAIVPCSMAWDAMEPLGEDDQVRLCHRCDHPVVRVSNLEALEPLIGRTCVAFTPRDELVLHVQGGPSLILRTHQSILVGSGPDVDVYVPDLPTRRSHHRPRLRPRRAPMARPWPRGADAHPGR